jgi:hypothetical protein
MHAKTQTQGHVHTGTHARAHTHARTPAKRTIRARSTAYAAVQGRNRIILVQLHNQHALERSVRTSSMQHVCGGVNREPLHEGQLRQQHQYEHARTATAATTTVTTTECNARPSKRACIS